MPLGEKEPACPANTPAQEQPPLHYTHNLTGQSTACRSVSRVTQPGCTLSLALHPPLIIPRDINVSSLKMPAVSDAAQENGNYESYESMLVQPRDTDTLIIFQMVLNLWRSVGDLESLQTWTD